VKGSQVNGSLICTAKSPAPEPLLIGNSVPENA